MISIVCQLNWIKKNFCLLFDELPWVKVMMKMRMLNGVEVFHRHNWREIDWKRWIAVFVCHFHCSFSLSSKNLNQRTIECLSSEKSLEQMKPRKSLSIYLNCKCSPWREIRTVSDGNLIALGRDRGRNRWCSWNFLPLSLTLVVFI